MHVVCCVWVHFSAHQAVGSDLLSGFLQSLTKLCQQASSEWLLPCSWHSRCAPCFSILLLLQRHPQVWMAPSHGDCILLLSRGAGSTEESGSSQYLQDVQVPRGMKDPMGILKQGIKQECNMEPWHQCSAALLRVHFSCMAASVQCSAASSHSLGSGCGVQHTTGPEVLLLTL